MNLLISTQSRPTGIPVDLERATKNSGVTFNLGNYTMKIGLKYTFQPNATKLNNIANLLLTGFGAGGAFTSAFDNPKIGSIMVAIGLLIKGIVTFTADDDKSN